MRNFFRVIVQLAVIFALAIEGSWFAEAVDRGWGWPAGGLAFWAFWAALFFAWGLGYSQRDKEARKRGQDN